MLLVVCFLIIPLSVLTFPKKAEAVCTPIPVPPLPSPFSVPVHDDATSVTKQQQKFQQDNMFFKNCILDGIAIVIAKTIIKQITKSIITWIQTGFKGNPSFVQNPGAFFGDVADKVAGNYIEQIAPFLCSPFKLNIQLALAMSQTSGGDNISCTLTDVENNLRGFVNNSGVSVTVGTNTNSNMNNYWDNWYNVTQNPQNNPYGAMMIASAQMTTNVQTSQGKYQQQLDWGQGFFSFEDCPPQQTQTIGGSNDAQRAPGSIPAGGAPVYGSDSVISYANPTNSNTNSLASIGSLGLLDSIFGDNSSSNALAQAQPMGPTGPSDELPLSDGTTLIPYERALNDFGTGLYSNSRDVGRDNRPVYTSSDPNTPVYGHSVSNNGCMTRTPGSVIGDQLNNVVGSDLRGLEIAQSIDQIIAALAGQLLTQALGGAMGLMGGGGGSSGGGGSGYTQKLLDSLNGTGVDAVLPKLPITGYCMPSEQTAQIGETITWNAYVPEINGAVTYAWHDENNNLLGNGSSATTSYTTNGTKAASVLVTTASDQTGQIIDCSPSVEIGEPSVTGSTPTIYCETSQNTVSVNTPVTWQAYALGGVPPFTYYWDGVDGLTGTGQSIVKSYTTASTTPKTARVYAISADGNTYTYACPNGVLVTP